MYKINYGYAVEISASYDDAVGRVIDALQEQGFGVLCDIDVRETLKNKLNIDFKRYRILGACNPSLAHKALTEEQDLGLLLPCNVVVYELNKQLTRVVAIDPVMLLELVGNKSLESIANDVKNGLQSALQALEQRTAII